MIGINSACLRNGTYKNQCSFHTYLRCKNWFKLLNTWIINSKTRNFKILYVRKITEAILYTATKISFMYSFSGNCAASVPKSKFMCLWPMIYGGNIQIAHRFMYSTWMWKWGLWPRDSFSGNIPSSFRYWFFAVYQTAQLRRFFTAFLTELAHCPTRKAMYEVYGHFCVRFPTNHVITFNYSMR